MNVYHAVPVFLRKVCYRPSDRVRGCGTAQFGKTRTILHNSGKFAKYKTIRTYLLKTLIKMRFSIEYQEI